MNAGLRIWGGARGCGVHYRTLFAQFHLHRLQGEPMIANMRTAIRCGVVHPDVGFHLIDIVSDVAVETQLPADPELEEAPPLSEARERRKAALQVALLRRSGEAEMARLLEETPDVYFAHSDKGRRRLAKRNVT